MLTIYRKNGKKVKFPASSKVELYGKDVIQVYSPNNKLIGVVNKFSYLTYDEETNISLDTLSTLDTLEDAIIGRTAAASIHDPIYTEEEALYVAKERLRWENLASMDTNHHDVPDKPTVYITSDLVNGEYHHEKDPRGCPFVVVGGVTFVNKALVRPSATQEFENDFVSPDLFTTARLLETLQHRFLQRPADLGTFLDGMITNLVDLSLTPWKRQTVATRCLAYMLNLNGKVISERYNEYLNHKSVPLAKHENEQPAPAPAEDTVPEPVEVEVECQPMSVDELSAAIEPVEGKTLEPFQKKETPKNRPRY